PPPRPRGAWGPGGGAGGARAPPRPGARERRRRPRRRHPAAPSPPPPVAHYRVERDDQVLLLGMIGEDLHLGLHLAGLEAVAQAQRQAILLPFLYGGEGVGDDPVGHRDAGHRDRALAAVPDVELALGRRAAARDAEGDL